MHIWCITDGTSEAIIMLQVSEVIQSKYDATSSKFLKYFRAYLDAHSEQNWHIFQSKIWDKILKYSQKKEHSVADYDVLLECIQGRFWNPLRGILWSKLKTTFE